MKEISLHILDICENSIVADASKIIISIHEDIQLDEIRINIQDNGNGIEKEVLENITDPFVTTRSNRVVGLGIPLFKAAASAANGIFTIESDKKTGTSINAVFQHSHIDRMPLGDIQSSLLTLVVSNPNIHWIFKYSNNVDNYEFDSNLITEILEDIPLTEPEVLHYLNTEFENGINLVQNSLNNNLPENIIYRRV